MAEIGKINSLTVIRQAEFGVYLDGGEFGGILLPKAEVPTECKVGDILDVFIYLDTDDFVVATKREPVVQVGEFANLKVAEVNRIGAFLDWGMPKHLLLPYGEQRWELKDGDRVIVRVYMDNSERLAASTKLDKFLSNPPVKLKTGDEVELLIARKGDLGFSCIVNNEYWALLHTQDVFRPVRIGQKITGYIKRTLGDGKVDVVLDKPGYGKVDDLSQKILNHLDAEGGESHLGDKSSPEEISQVFGVSKKSYKMAIGGLKKQGLIEITPTGIRKL